MACSKCAENAKKRAAARKAQLAAQSNSAPSAAYAKAVAKGKTSK